MQAIEFETRIDEEGQVRLPEEFHHAYGKLARLVVLLADVSDHTTTAIDPMQYGDTLDWPVDGTDSRGDTAGI